MFCNIPRSYKIYTAMGKLLNVSTNTIGRWEAGTSKPRESYRPGLAQLRTMGVREVKKLLGEYANFIWIIHTSIRPFEDRVFYCQWAR